MKFSFKELTLLSCSNKTLTIMLKGGIGDQLKHLMGGLILAKEFNRELRVVYHVSLNPSNSLVNVVPEIPFIAYPDLPSLIKDTIGNPLEQEWFDGKGDRENITGEGSNTIFSLIRKSSEANKGFFLQRAFLEKYQSYQHVYLFGTRYEFDYWQDNHLLIREYLKLLRIPPLTDNSTPAIHARRGDRSACSGYAVPDIKDTVGYITNYIRRKGDAIIYTDSPEDFLDLIPEKFIRRGGTALEDILSLARHRNIVCLPYSGFSIAAKIFRTLQGRDTSLTYPYIKILQCPPTASFLSLKERL